MPRSRTPSLQYLRQAAIMTGFAVLASMASEPASTQELPDSETIVPRDGSLYTELQIRVNNVVVRGNTLLPPSVIEQIIEPFRQRNLTNDDLQALREQLSRAYLDRGYVNSGVTIPDQTTTDGSLYLDVVEGTLTDIVVRERARLRPTYITSRLRRRINAPLNVFQLQDAIRLLQQDDHIDRIDAELVPTQTRGQGRLYVSVEEAPRLHVGITANNHRSESIGAEHAVATIGYSNLTGFGDSLSLSVGISAGSENGSVRYRLPTLPNNAELSIFASRSDATVLEEPFDELTVESTTDTLGTHFRWPLVDRLDTDLNLELGLEYKTSTTTLLGVPFSLGPGAIDGVSKESVISLGLDWVYRSQRHVLALKGGWRRGINVGNPTRAIDNPADITGADGLFDAFLAQFQFTRALTTIVRITIRGTTQWTSQSLMSLEKIAVGGVNSVRGYRENLLVRDRGGHASIELPIRVTSTLSIVPFVDAGVVADVIDTAPSSVVRNTDQSRMIVSAGLGLNWNPWPWLTTDVYWGADLANNFDQDDPRDSITERGIQDHGFHLSVALSRRF